MATLFVRHEVKDFDTWKAAYDAFDAERSQMGVVGQGTYQADGNPKDVTVYHHFETMDQAKAFVDSDRLQEVMLEAGVIGAPTIWFANRI